MKTRFLFWLCMFFALPAFAQTRTKNLQSLPSRINLSQEQSTQTQRKVTKAKSGQLLLNTTKAPVTEGNLTTYFFESQFETDDETKKWASTFVFNSDNKTVTIENLFEGLITDYDYSSSLIIVPVSDNKIILPTNSYEKDDPQATIVGQNEEDYIALLAGTYDAENDGVALETTLALDMNSDTTVISSNGKTIVLYEVSDYWGDGVIVAAREGLSWYRLSDEALSEISETELDFGTIYYTQNKNYELELIATAIQPVPYSITIEGEGFETTEKEGIVYYNEPIYIPVQFTPQKPGEYSGILKVKAADLLHSVSLKGKAIETPNNFNELITEGDPTFFTHWQNTSNSPWEPSGNMASTNNNLKLNGPASLLAQYKSEEPVRITFDYSVDATATDTLFFKVDQDVVFGYTSKYNNTFSYVLPEGEHTIEWIFFKGEAGYKADNASIGNIRLTPAQEFEGIEHDQRIQKFACNGFTAYNSVFRPEKEYAELSFTAQTTNLQSCIEFEIEATQEAPLTITINDEIHTITHDSVFHANLTGIQEHTINITYNNNTGDAKYNGITGIKKFHLSDQFYKQSEADYIVFGKSYYDKLGEFSITDGVKGISIPVQITFTSTGRIYINNLFPQKDIYSNYLKTYVNTVEGTIKDGKIELPAGNNINVGTFLAYNDETYSITGKALDRFWLASGKLNGPETADRVLEETLTMSVSEDSTILKVNQGLGFRYTYIHNDKGFIQFLQEGVRLEKVIDGVSIISSEEELDFGTTYAQNGSITSELVILNKGTLPTDCALEIEGDNNVFSVTPRTLSLNSLESESLQISFTPQAEREYTARLIIYSEGEDKIITLKGKGENLPDYSTIVNKGKELITGWSTSTEYPWKIEEGWAVSSNTARNNTTSELSMQFTVPDGKYVRLSLDADYSVEPEGDFFRMKLNEQTLVYMDQTRHDIPISYIVGPGNYTVSFSHEKDYMTLIPSADISKIRNICLEQFEMNNNLGMTGSPRYRYDLIVPMDKGAQTEIYVINKGTDPITITSAETESPFHVIIPDKAIASGDTVAVAVEIKPLQTGFHKSDILLHTSAGEINCTLEATADYVRYLGGRTSATLNLPVCTFYTMYYVYPIYSQQLYQSHELEGLEGAQITEMTFETVMEGDIDYTSSDVIWKVGEYGDEIIEEQPSGLTSVYEGEQIDVINYEQTIKFKEPYTYNGGNFMVALEMNSKENIDFPVYYYCTEENEGLGGVYLPDSGIDFQKTNYVPSLRIKYIPNGTGISNTQTEAGKVVQTNYYNIIGMRIPKPVQGINLVEKIFEDGSRKVEKIQVK